jgi:hypothetical protein
MLNAERLAERAKVVETLRSSGCSGRPRNPGWIAIKVMPLILADLAVIKDNGDPWLAAVSRRQVVDEWYSLIYPRLVTGADEGSAAER